MDSVFREMAIHRLGYAARFELIANRYQHQLAMEGILQANLDLNLIRFKANGNFFRSGILNLKINRVSNVVSKLFF